MAKVNERLVADQAARLGVGGLGYTPRQLYYAVCAALERPQVTVGTSQAALGGILVVAGVAGGLFASVYLLPLVVIGLVVAGLGLQNRRRERAKPSSRPLALGYDEFVAAVVAPRLGGNGVEPLAGLLLDTEPQDASRSSDGGLPLVVCDHRETAALLSAINGTAGFAVQAVAEEDAARMVKGRRVYALHDCDPSGCGLPLRLRDDGAAEVVDLGLRPAQIARRPAQMIEGAPAIVPRETAAVLSPDEMVWLAEGRRVELAVLTPQELLEGVRRALSGGAVQPPGPAPAGVSLAEIPLVLPMQVGPEPRLD
ncbi:MAG TPA: hypothetical protein VGQ42_06705 [Candidatus Dormibacteraeota bacterium]|jgi:hypothetical protein|nr:hypothetical protein [Candidatus Dormibacteraeota bacterium]